MVTMSKQIDDQTQNWQTQNGIDLKIMEKQWKENYGP